MKFLKIMGVAVVTLAMIMAVWATLYLCVPKVKAGTDAFLEKIKIEKPQDEETEESSEVEEEEEEEEETVTPAPAPAVILSAGCFCQVFSI